MNDERQNYSFGSFFYRYQDGCKFLILIVLLIPLIFYGWRISLRSSRVNLQKQLASGIVYQKKVFSQPRPYIVHLVAIDLNNSQIKPLVTPPHGKNNSNLAIATSKFIQKFDLKLAINGSFFYPFAEDSPWNYYPRDGELANALGESIANGKRYGRPGDRWSVLCFSPSNVASIRDRSCPLNTIQGIAGRKILVKNGNSIIDYDTDNYGRSAVAIDSTGKKLWLIVIDGKQPFYSEGATLKELAQIIVDLGCDRALNLDGGGSSTLAINTNNNIAILNAPIHTKIPMRERPVANHLGFFISP